MRDDDWLATPEGPPAGSRRRRAWLVAAAVPWLLVAGIVLALRPDAAPAGDGSAATRAAVGTAHPEPPVDAAPAPDERGDIDDGDAPDPDADTEHAGGRTTPDDAVDVPGAAVDAGLERTNEDLRGQAAATAVVIARSFVTGVEPALVIQGVRPDPGLLYAEHLAVETVRILAPGPDDDAGVVPALATVQVVVLDAALDLQPDLRRIAVPLAVVDGEVRPAGRPWWLPAPNLHLMPPPVTPVDDADLALVAAESLADAGLHDIEVEEVAAAPGWPVVVFGRDASGQEVTVWLEAADGRLRVMGAQADPSGAADPADGTDPTSGAELSAGGELP